MADTIVLSGQGVIALPDGTPVVITLTGTLQVEVALIGGNTILSLVPAPIVLVSLSTVVACSQYLTLRSVTLLSGAKLVPVKLPAPSPLNIHALGAYIVLNGQYMEGSPAIMDTYAAMVGKMPAMVNFGSNVGVSWVGSQFDNIRQRGAQPCYTMMPTSTCQDVLSGVHDAFFKAFAQSAKAWGHPFLLRFAHEQNGNWYSYGYGGGHNGNTPTAYAQMWKRVHDIFTAVGAFNVKWVWCVNNSPFDPASYPGDSCTDYLAMDGYNYGGTAWQNCESVFGATYRSLSALSSKPMLITEMGSVESGGSKASWITDAFAHIAQSFPRVVGVLWFNAPYGSHQVTVDTSASSLAAFKSVATSPLWKGTLSLS